MTDLEAVLRRLIGRINDIRPGMSLDEAEQIAAGDNRGVRIWCAFTAAEIVVMRAALEQMEERWSLS